MPREGLSRVRDSASLLRNALGPWCLFVHQAGGPIVKRTA